VNFLSPYFLILYPVLLLVYRRLRKKGRTVLLLFESALFYVLMEPRFALLFFGEIVLTWVLAGRAAALRLEGGEQADKRRRLVTAIGVIVPLAVLAVFKYAGLFSDAFKGGIIPAGISFYTFQALSYVIDVSSGRTEHEKNPLYYALYLSFFPQLVAGPIERAGDLLPQLKTLDRTPSGNEKLEGLSLMVRGYFKKVVIADSIAALVDTVFSMEHPAGFTVLLGAILFSFQIYGDFSGYTDIARGSSLLLGIRLMENFRMPYLSTSVSSFYRRWHISLNRWFRDYVYIPLGGSRRGKLRHLVNILLLFSLSGLWHGSGLHYLFWGLSSGLLICLEILTGTGKEQEMTAPVRAVRTILTFLLVSLCWIFFRAENTGRALTLFSCLFSGGVSIPELAGVFGSVREAVLLIPAILSLYLLDRESTGKEDLSVLYLRRRAAIFFTMGLLIVLTFLLHQNQGVDNAFIYFRF